MVGLGVKMRASARLKRCQAGEKCDRKRPAVSRIMRRDEAANYLGFDKGGAAFDAYCRLIGVSSLAGRRGAYDRIAIDAALNRQNGCSPDTNYESADYG